MNKFYVIQIADAGGVKHSYGIVAPTMNAALTAARSLAGVTDDVEADSQQALYPRVDAVVS